MTNFNPGPLDGSVLYDQDNHISSEIWNGKEPQVLRCIPADPKKGIWRLNARMRRYIWAYSRMAIGRPICRSMESIKFKYPLFKMWEQRLLKHKVLTTVEDVRQQLDGQSVDSFDWRPYDQFGDKLSAQVEERDRALFRSATMMIYYWITERHNVDRVLKQFGLRQPVPPPLYPQSKSDERSSNAPVDYRVKMREVITDWQARHDAVINGDVDDLVGCHHDEYLQWYRRITRNQISRPSEERDTRYEQPIQQVKRFLEWQIATLDSVEEESGPSISYRVIRRVRRKSENFRAACASNFENFNLDDCINSQSDED